jgi:hypothetical protein
MTTWTRTAEAWFQVARRFMIPKARRLLVERAQEIRQRRGASMLGKVHLELALEELTEETEQ